MIFKSLSDCYLPTDIVFLRTTIPTISSFGSFNYGKFDVRFDILEGNVESAFDIVKRVENGVYVGEYRNFSLLCKVRKNQQL